MALGPETEIIVVDGGSSDNTARMACRHATVLRAQPSRGAQLRRGAAVASGRVLVFLHADTWLPPDAGDRIRAALGAGAGSGCFRFGLRGGKSFARRLLELSVNWRSRTFATATGDQAIFASRATYDACGGHPPLPLFDDLAFVKAARRTAPFVVLGSAALTSPRRWETRGFWRTVAEHWFYRLAWTAGVSPHRLARSYYGEPASARGDRP